GGAGRDLQGHVAHRGLVPARIGEGDAFEDDVVKTVLEGVGVGELLALDRFSGELDGVEDRKSTRLNSSHVSSSYAVFCLEKTTYHVKSDGVDQVPRPQAFTRL